MNKIKRTGDDGDFMQESQKKGRRGDPCDHPLTHIMKVDEILSQAQGLNDLFFEFAKPHLDYLAKSLQISRTGAALFAILAASFNGDSLPLAKLAKQLDLKCLQLMAHMGEFEILEAKGLVNIRWDRHSREGIEFDLDFKLIDELRKGNFRNLSNDKGLSIDKFFSQLKRLFRDSDSKAYKSVTNKMRRLLNNNTHLLLVKKIQKLKLDDADNLILLSIFDDTVNDDNPETGLRSLARLFEDSEDVSDFHIKRSLATGRHILFREKIIEHSCSDGFADTDYVCLTRSAKDEFLAELDFVEQNFSVRGLKNAQEIAEKKLFYPAKTNRAIEELYSLLQPGNFTDVQKRLSESGMRTGFACLFSGGAGTGKTETAYQVARITGRDIMHVDIASTKSKWFGESQKAIKAVFDKYRNAVQKCSVTPILFFNEADAIFSKRHILSEKRDGPGQTENAIQNIILQEMENLSGILIATTNMTKNLDAAFERRFLYKIEFDKPEAQARKSIWSALLPGLSDNDALALASRFDFSGGQIENIARKSTVHKVVAGKEPALEDLVLFCSDEIVNNQNAKAIGFASNTQTGVEK